MKVYSRFHTGFTLIELLIVVAIIGILAAIAIPNFLAAQIRAKTSRSVSDLRTIATALEMYQLDTGWYPGDWYPVVNCWGGTLQQGWDINFTLRGLSTPIEYLSEIPAEDPFGEGVTSTSAGTYIYVNDADQGYYADGCGTGNTGRFQKISKPDMSGFEWPFFFWYMKSQGPDRSYEWWGTWEQLYDPTNGLVSNGEIARAGP